MKGLVLIGASAGTGKTHRLTAEVKRRLDPLGASAIPPESLVAVTYTRKAEAELKSRVRQALLAAGNVQEAMSLPLAFVGTTHAVCLRLLEELAVEAGFPPGVHVLPNEQLLLRAALEQALDIEVRDAIDKVARRLEIGWNAQLRRIDWVTPVHAIVTLARMNRIAASALPEMAERSLAGYRHLLPPAAPDGDELERMLDDALTAAESGLVSELASPKTSGAVGIQNALDVLRECRAARSFGRRLWSHWAKLSSLEGGKRAAAALDPVNRVALRVLEHPKLQHDIETFTRLAFRAAQLTLDSFTRLKIARRGVDYVDMIDRALTTLELPQIEPLVADRFKLLVVDEFQDTTPLQLALFMRLHKLTGQSAWVGDPKQCIFEYSGADPALMDAVAQWHRGEEGETEQLTTNYRSRQELVAACSHLFAAAFAAQGVPPEQTRVGAKRGTMPELPPFGAWWLTASNLEQEAECLAEGVRTLLGRHAARDIAILVTTNAEAMRIARALERAGIPANASQMGLLATPEASVIRAGIDWLLDSDSRAAAELDALLTGADLRDWIEARLGDQSPPQSSWAATLRPIQAMLPALSALEVVDAVIHALGLPTVTARWPEPGQRLANLEGIRRLVRDYEAQAAERREPPTLRGLQAWLDEISDAFEQPAVDAQMERSAHEGVTVITYHRSKGLEWPVVVLSSLDHMASATSFEVTPETTATTFDPEQPLSGRWVRYWPWPFGVSANDVLENAAGQSPEGRLADLRAKRERLRLLYVGFTRARDQLVLAIRDGKTARKRWLDQLVDTSGSALLTLPAKPAASPQTGTILARDEHGDAHPFAAELMVLQPQPLADSAAAASPRWFPTGSRRDRPTYRIRPSDKMTLDGAPSLVAGETIRIHPGLAPALAGGNRLRVGKLAHAFLAADREDHDSETRLSLARRILSAAGMATTSPAELLGAADALRRFVEPRWPGARWYREVPVDVVVQTPDGERAIAGVMDLLLETSEGLVLIDHKTAVAEESEWSGIAMAFAAQMSAYAHALALSGRTVAAVWLHLVVSGAVVELRVEPG